jgi:hypothetical protein
MTVYGVPEEVLTGNGTVFTGRFIKPRPAEPGSTGESSRACRQLNEKVPSELG